MPAIALYEKRQFTNPSNGEIIAYDYYGIKSEVNGRFEELPLKNLNPAEKIAWRSVASGEIPVDTSDMQQTVTRGGEVEITTILDEPDDNEKGMFD